MADTKITGLTNFDSSNTPYWPPAPASDVIPIVDISDNTMAASGTTKKISINNLLSSSPTATGALTVTGLVTAGSATVTGDLTVDTSTLKVDSANDAVGIGTTSPTTYGAKLAVFGSGNGILAVGNATSYTTLQSNGNDFYLNMKGVGSTVFRLGSGDTESMRLNPTGNVVLKGGTIGADGVGVTFPATQVASSDANCLDDYEEGTFTATLKGSTTDPATPVTSTARYTKIGRVVNVIIYFGNVNTTGASGAIQVIGLPFTSGSGPFYPGSAVSGDTATFTGTLGAWIAPASTQVDVLASVSGGSVAGATHNAGASRYLALNVTYTV